MLYLYLYLYHCLYVLFLAVTVSSLKRLTAKMIHLNKLKAPKTKMIFLHKLIYMNRF